MRAAVLRTPGEPLTIEDITLAPPKKGEIVVRVEAAGVCHSDYHYMTGDITCPLPAVLGHEGAGIVEEVGPESSGRVSVGQRVALMWRPRCGECPACIAGNPVLCRFGPLQATTGGLPDGTSRLSRDGEKVHHFLGVSCFADRVVVSERSVVPVPDGVPAHIAAIAGCAVITGVGAVFHAVGECAGRSLLVLGAGGVGLSAVMGARLSGADPIVVVDIDPRKLEHARRLGATATIDARSGDVVAQVLAEVPGGVDFAIEAIGRPQTLQQAFDALSPAGTLVAVGLGRVGETFAIPVNQLVQRQKRIIGSLYGSANPLIDLPRIFGLYLSGRLPLDELVGTTYPLESVNEAYDDLRGAVGRGVIVP
ncbi:zinc-binding dehydrogenase [Naasia sp. SYSU D00948]|uniref:zinc-binding dehydrogenase n=1 Tax=Naasia sp. SYSU D00948 TaxID=2817379 RepID=UPI001B313EF8|nr:Zn-dependent alcohol dehydrogenase [Naasia sp. SYSU D00948]